MRPEDSLMSERENEVAKILLQGKSNKQIALALGISTRTVEFHLRNIYTKLGVASRTEAVLKLTESQLWKTPGEAAGSHQVKPTVDAAGISTENEPKFILRRIPVKTYAVIGSLLAAFLVAVLAMMRLPAAQAGEAPAAPITLPVPSADLSTASFPIPTEPAWPARASFPSHTVNGYTAAIESYYIDPANLIFQVRITGEGIVFGDSEYYGRVRLIDLYDQNGSVIDSSAGTGPAIDPELIQMEFHPLTQLTGDRLKGQFAFDLNKTSAWEETLARFHFDFDLPVYEPVIHHPGQVVGANGLEMLLDQVTITPEFTQVHLCFPPPSYADWQIGSRSVLKIGEQEATPVTSTVQFDSALGGDRRAGYEPYWAPPVKSGRCVKSGFPIGSRDASSLTLAIPQLESSAPDVLLTGQLARDYPGLSPMDAYYKYLEESGNTYRGPWIFTIKLTP